MLQKTDFNHLVTAICTRYLFYLYFRIFPDLLISKSIRNNTNCQHIPQYSEVVIESIDFLSLLGAGYVSSEEEPNSVFNSCTWIKPVKHWNLHPLFKNLFILTCIVKVLQSNEWNNIALQGNWTVFYFKNFIQYSYIFKIKHKLHCFAGQNLRFQH